MTEPPPGPPPAVAEQGAAPVERTAWWEWPFVAVMVPVVALRRALVGAWERAVIAPLQALERALRGPWEAVVRALRRVLEPVVRHLVQEPALHLMAALRRAWHGVLWLAARLLPVRAVVRAVLRAVWWALTPVRVAGQALRRWAVLAGGVLARAGRSVRGLAEPLLRPLRTAPTLVRRVSARVGLSLARLRGDLRRITDRARAVRDRARALLRLGRR